MGARACAASALLVACLLQCSPLSLCLYHCRRGKHGVAWCAQPEHTHSREPGACHRCIIHVAIPQGRMAHGQRLRWMAQPTEASLRLPAQLLLDCPRSDPNRALCRRMDAAEAASRSCVLVPPCPGAPITPLDGPPATLLTQDAALPRALVAANDHLCVQENRLT